MGRVFMTKPLSPLPEPEPLTSKLEELNRSLQSKKDKEEQPISKGFWGHFFRKSNSQKPSVLDYFREIFVKPFKDTSSEFKGDALRQLEGHIKKFNKIYEDKDEALRILEQNKGYLELGDFNEAFEYEDEVEAQRNRELNERYANLGNIGDARDLGDNGDQIDEISKEFDAQLKDQLGLIESIFDAAKKQLYSTENKKIIKSVQVELDKMVNFIQAESKKAESKQQLKTKETITEGIKEEKPPEPKIKAQKKIEEVEDWNKELKLLKNEIKWELKTVQDQCKTLLKKPESPFWKKNIQDLDGIQKKLDDENTGYLQIKGLLIDAKKNLQDLYRIATGNQRVPDDFFDHIDETIRDLHNEGY